MVVEEQRLAALGAVRQMVAPPGWGEVRVGVGGRPVGIGKLRTKLRAKAAPAAVCRGRPAARAGVKAEG
nr:hypothetical protein [Mycobacterium basiliense]